MYSGEIIVRNRITKAKIVMFIMLYVTKREVFSPTELCKLPYINDAQRDQY